MSVPFDELTIDPYAPPATPALEVQVDEVVPAALAGRGTRLLAKLIDGLAVGVPAISLVAIDEDTASDAMLLVVGFLAIVMVAVMIVQCVLLYTRGQTLGKLACRVRIVRDDGRRAGLARLLFLRSGVLMALRFIPQVGNTIPFLDTLMIFRADRRCLHDHIADTVVVKTRRTDPSPTTADRPPLPPEIATTQPAGS